MSDFWIVTYQYKGKTRTSRPMTFNEAMSFRLFALAQGGTDIGIDRYEEGDE